jgi:mediator of RNA polymerase II transcription subunit 5
MFNDLVVAHFDVIAAIVLGEESQQALRLCRSYLTSKLPPLLSLAAESSLEPISAEQCLSQALQQVDSEIASISSTTPNSSQHISLLREVRQEFVLACHLHKLISTNSITSILGASPTQKQPHGNHYVKDDLIHQIRTNHSRADRLIGEVSAMQGNAGTIVQALIEVRVDSSLCSTLFDVVTRSCIDIARARRPRP